MQVTAPSLTSEEYPKVWKQFTSGWPEREIFISWFSKLVPFISQQKDLKALSVGAGLALFELELLEMIRKESKIDIDFTFLEPNPEHFTGMSKNVAQSQLSNFSANLSKDTWEQFELSQQYN